ncbi:lipopolysaccharide biosynthesis protein [Mycolicibacterium sp. CBM1]
MTELPSPGSGDDHAEIEAEHQHKLRLLLRSAAALVSTSIVTSGLGFVYWALAARMFNASDVGESATAISAMSLIAPFTVLGFGTVLIARLPAMQVGRARLIATTAVVSGTVGTAVALLAAFTLPSAFLGLPGIGHDVGITVLFTAAVATQSIGYMLDQALLSSLGGGIQLGRNTVQAVVKLALLAAFALTLHRYGSLTIFASWFIANVVSITAVTIVLIRRFRVGLRGLIPELSALRGLHFEAAKHHALNIALFTPFFAMPILGNVLLGSEVAGYLYATWSIAGFLFYVPIALATALFASGARDSRTFAMEFGFTLRYALLICTAANLGVLLLGHWVLHIFGAAYADSGRQALIVMCLGGFGLIVKDHHVAVARVAGTVGREAMMIAVLGMGELAGAAVGAAHGGLTGLALGWLSAVALEMAVCAPTVVRMYRGRLLLPIHSGLDGRANATEA